MFLNLGVSTKMWPRHPLIVLSRLKSRLAG